MELMLDSSRQQPCFCLFVLAEFYLELQFLVFFQPADCLRVFPKNG